MLGGGYETLTRLFLQALIGALDAAHDSLLARHMVEIRDEACELDRAEIVQHAE